MRALFIVLALTFFTAAVLNFINFFSLTDHYLYSGLAFLLAIVCVAMQDFYFYRAVKKKEKELENKHKHKH